MDLVSFSVKIIKLVKCVLLHKIYEGLVWIELAMSLVVIGNNQGRGKMMVFLPAGYTVSMRV